MKRSRLFLLLIIVLVIVAVVLVFRKSASSTLDENCDFAVTDTASITKIFLADMSNNKVLLVKNAPGNWTVNDKYVVSPESIKMLLKTVMSLELKSPVPRAAHNNIVKIIASSGTKVEIYQKVYRLDLFNWIRWFPHEKCTKTYYVGFATQDNLGTYMLMADADEPFVIFIPGFNGFLTTRYSPMEKDWRDHTVFNYRYKDIKSVKLHFPEAPENSFRIVKDGPRDFKLFQQRDEGGTSTNEISRFDSVRVMDYLAAFENIRFEAIVNDLDKHLIDSIKNAVPFHILTIEDINGKQSTIKTFHMKGTPDQLDINNNPVLWDRDRLYALINNGNDLVLIQFFVFDPILRPLSYFLPGKPVIKTQ
jgi:hypothetical protein